MVTAGSAGSLDIAKKSFTNAFIGLIIILSAWLIVDTLMRGLIGGNGDVKGWGPWSSVRCDISQAGVDEQSGFFAVNEYDVAPPSASDNDILPGVVDGPTGKSGLNPVAASKYIVAHAYPKSAAECWKAVRSALCAGGAQGFCTPGPYYAKDAGPKLLKNGYTLVYSGTYSYPATDNAFKAQPGDVAIFNGCSDPTAGHASMYTSSGSWYSDFKQQEMGPNKKGRCPVAIYRP
jgi:hypothetical protein